MEAHSADKDMGSVIDAPDGASKEKASTKKLSIMSETFKEVKTTVLQQVGHFAKAHTIPAELVIN